MEQTKNPNYENMLKLLKTIKTPKYNKFKTEKEKFYKKKTILYNKK